MKFNKVKEELRELKEENQKMREIINGLINERDDVEIIKKVKELKIWKKI